MKSKRIKWLDFAKGLTVFFVVILHTSVGDKNLNDNQIYINYIFYLLHIFVMPVFFAVSGYLYKRITNLHGYKILLYKKITSFVIPYLVFNALIIFLQHPRNLFFLFYHIEDVILYPSAWLWFLYVLFFIFCIIGLLDLFKVSLSVDILISILLLMLSNFQMPIQRVILRRISNLNPYEGGVDPILGLEGYFICFLLGYIIKKYHITVLLHKKEFTLFIFIIWIIFDILQYKITHNLANVNMFNYYDSIPKLVSIALFFSFYINFKTDNFLFKYFTKYGKYTLVIYLVHFPFSRIFLPYLGLKIKFIYYLVQNYPILYGILGLCISWCISILSCKLLFNIKLVHFIFYPRKYINNIFKINL